MNFKTASPSEILECCGDKAELWAEAFCELIELAPSVDRDTMVSWFANAIETSCDVRTRSYQDKINALTSEREALEQQILADNHLNEINTLKDENTRLNGIINSMGDDKESVESQHKTEREITRFLISCIRSGEQLSPKEEQLCYKGIMPSPTKGD